MPTCLSARARRDRRAGQAPAARFKRQHSSDLALQASLAAGRTLPPHRKAAGTCRDRRSHDLLVARAAKTSLSMAATKMRLDELLVARGLASSRAQAKALIMSGRVRRGTERLDKPGKEFAEDIELTVDQPPRFVSRGGEKLAAALENFQVDLRGAHVLDVGASTGGFTDCALQAGA